MPWAALACLMLMSACVVQVNEQLGYDPCDPNPCQKAGVCSGWTGTCSVVANKAVCKQWKWTAKTAAPKDEGGKALTVPAGYETSEKTCDGKDNDCDGQIDEAVVGDASKVCATQGVCAGAGVGALCVGGNWMCNYAAVAAYEASETTCDGKDNDCDGQVDDNLLAPAAACKRQGVCGGLQAPTCSAGAWDCGYTGAADYQASETKCDGKDNDCDGQVDTALDVTALAATVQCKASGVCAGAAVVACQSGAPTCTYTGAVGFEAVEVSCDGKDNDCDGKTDNYPGSDVALALADASGCAVKGVCGLGKVGKTCVAGEMVCNYSSLAGYEANETSCDGKDNNCDGQVDNVTTKPATSPCGDKGVCAGGVPLCSASLWSCDWASLTAKGYQAFEQSCDGLDNDCDGKTDESTAPEANGCLGQGVCGFGVAVACSAGKGTCDYSHVAGYQGATETACDGLDNDCDGKTDEPESLDAAASGCTKGVCAGKATASCSAGNWACNTAAVVGFEGTEKSCDGLDNDCDGLTDESLSDPAGCPTQGLCSGGVKAYCVGGKYMCDFSGVAGYEAQESSCDGKDNDCDGKTDTGLCGPTATCSQDTQCAGGACLLLGSGPQKVCGSAKQCPVVGADGKVAIVVDGGAVCSTASALQICTAGSLGPATTCPVDKPVCAAGQCVVCAPSAKTCDPADKSKVVQCDADGLSAKVTGSCSGGERCAGAGDCVPDGPFAISDSSEGISDYKAVGLEDGSVVVIWAVDKAGAGELRARLFTSAGAAKGSSAIIHGNLPAGSATQLAATAITGGFAVAWTVSGTDGDIALGLFDLAAKAKGSPAIAHADAAGAQTQPALSSTGTFLQLVYTDSLLDQDGTCIATRRFDLQGKALGPSAVVNDDPDVSDSTSGDQETAAVACRGNGECGVVYTHRQVTGKGRVRGRQINAGGTPSGSVLSLSTLGLGSNQVAPSITWTGTGYVAVWQGDGWDASPGTGIALRPLDTAFKLKPGIKDLALNQQAEGNQSQPEVVSAGGGAVAVWGIAGLGSLRDITGTGSAVGSEINFAKGATAEASLMPHLAVLTDGKQLLLYLTDKSGTLTIQAVFR